MGEWLTKLQQLARQCPPAGPAERRPHRRGHRDHEERNARRVSAPRPRQDGSDLHLPAAGAWEIYPCRQCMYSRRTSERAGRSQRDAYPDSFKMTIDDIRNAVEFPVVPPLR
ncbi:non-oxidative hydroxyarylic acid decarboxylases subunit D [Streptomyces sp. NPDC059466]|uniref:non-oxidative hydroxyarylic acid decarboxylases subunit D n=1 Tax=unclassified Streptomyces TaxID=2593676 RepID=UPI0036C94BD5